MSIICQRCEHEWDFLNLAEYCEYCPDFEPTVSKFDITSLGDKERRVQSSIMCEFSDRCEKIYNRTKQEAQNEQT